MEALPSFLGDKDVVVDVPELGKVKLEDFFGIFPLKPSSSGHSGPGLWWHVVCHRGSRAGNRKTRNMLFVKGWAETGAGTWKENCQAGGDDQGGFSVFY